MNIVHKELTINEIEQFHEALMLELNTLSEMHIDLDFSEVELIDLCAFQLLISFKKYCESNEIGFSFTNINSNQIHQSLKIYNLHERLGIVL